MCSTGWMLFCESTAPPIVPSPACKAQGLTLKRVMVDLARGAFADGQVYVALSRCQSMEGLSLKRPVRVSEVRCSEAARSFYERMRMRGNRREVLSPES